MINRSNNKLYFDYSINLQLAFTTKRRIGCSASIHRCELSMDMELGLPINLACMDPTAIFRQWFPW
jgi:hypothetical protein